MKIKINQIVSIIFLLCFPSIIFSQTADEIIAKHIEAHGGADKWNKVEALKITGKFTGFSLEKDYTSYKTKSGLYYADLYLGEINIIEAFNGDFGWTIDPWQEFNYARKVNAGEENAFMQKAEFFTPFFNYKEKGHTVDYTGKETMDGMEVFVFELTRNNGKVETWYLNAETYLEHICKSDWVDFARTLPSEIFFDDFRTVDGLVIPFFTDRTFWQRDRVLQIEEVEINPEIDKKIFEMPRRKELEKLAFLQGEWDVNVQVWWAARGIWYDMGNATSSIDFVLTNMLQENISYERTYLVSKIVNYTYNDARQNYRISVFNDLSTSLNVFEGNFNDTALIFDNTNITFGDTINDERNYTQYLISNIEKDSFILEIKRSMDEGSTWAQSDRFTYTRKED